ncbi:MAG: ribonuclease P protein component [Nannocystaceae bacterium]|nr:ribonuclease P protein component [Nannocystaceae bacterium]
MDRNRIKRLVREAFRREGRRFAAGLDLVWVAKRDALKVNFLGVMADMRTLADRLVLLPAPSLRGEDS